MIAIKNFDDREEQFKWLAENHDVLKAQRRADPKKSDALSFVSFAINDKGERLKAEDLEGENSNPDVLKVRCIINTTNLFDSHSDVHFPGIWKKSLSENKIHTLCNNHNFTFEGTISDDVKAYTKTYTWKELGFKYEGETEALVFDTIINKEDNEFMFNLYKKGRVKNHSVRMQYVKEYFCMNSDNSEYTQYKENWDKYIDKIANKDDVEKKGYFYAVTEAKIIEGSAVKRGSNFCTPTIEFENKSQAEKSLENKEPPKGTQLEKKKVFIN